MIKLKTLFKKEPKEKNMSNFFNEISNNYKQIINGNTMIIKNLIEIINENIKKFSKLGYCGLSVILKADYSETAPPSIFDLLEKHYKDQEFTVLIGHNYIKIYWVDDIEEIPYSYYNSSIASLTLYYDYYEKN